MFPRTRPTRWLFIAIILLFVLAPAWGWAHDLSGCWSGGWYSCSNGHRGPLQASFCRLDNGDYVVEFRGRFLLNLIPFRYSVTLNVVEETEDHVQLRGQSYLGRLAGTFYYDATATGDEFRADYSSCNDNGYFWLQRCCQ
jgi:hypothetical protein